MDRTSLGCVDKGKHPAYEIKHAHILLKSDAAGPAWTDAASLKRLGVIRGRFIMSGGVFWNVACLVRYAAQRRESHLASRNLTVRQRHV